MRIKKALISMVTLLAVFAMVWRPVQMRASSAAFQEIKSIYSSKCAVCHGAEGQGKVGPALKGTSLSADDIVALLTSGNDAKKAPHKKGISGLSADDAKAVADYVKSLK